MGFCQGLKVLTYTGSSSIEKGCMAGDACPFAHGREEAALLSLALQITAGRADSLSSGLLSPSKVQDTAMQWRAPRMSLKTRKERVCC